MNNFAPRSRRYIAAKKPAILTLLMLLFSTSSSFAFIDDQMLLGPGVEVKSNNRVNNTADRYDSSQITHLVPVGFFKWGPLMVNDKGLQLSITNTLPFALYLVTNIHGYKYRSTSIDTRDTSFFVGGGVRIYPLSVYHMKDAENKSEGSLTIAQLQAPWRVGDWLLAPTVGYTYYNEYFNNYYFGVSSGEATVEIPSFAASSGNDVFVNLRVFYRINETWEVYFMAESRFFSDEITNSPTVTEDSLQKYVLGVTYKVF